MFYKYRTAFFSDIHSNFEALTAVLDDIDRQGITSMICLGDTVGYGADPGACLQTIMDRKCPCLLGNHDAACIQDLHRVDMNDYALAGVEFSRRQLSGHQLAFLKGLPMKLERKRFTAVHSSLIRFEKWAYLLEDSDVETHFHWQKKPVAFCGHTHRPCVWAGSADGAKMLGCFRMITLDSGPLFLINVGSVGQPRDQNANACYVTMDWEKNAVTFHRVKYDIRAAQRKIIKAKLPRFTAQRLKLGR